MVKFALVDAGNELDAETKAELRARFEANEGCRWCGGLHPGECPRVKRIVYHPTDDRQVREVEFWADVEWSRQYVLFPEDVM